MRLNHMLVKGLSEATAGLEMKRTVLSQELRVGV